MNVLITRENWRKIINYAESAYRQFKTEIGGMSVCIKNKDGDWVIHDPVILKQDVTGGNTHLKKKELAIYYTDAHSKYRTKDYRFLWWHSHHTMGAFWSGTDLDTIDEFNDGDFSFALVVNLKEEYKCRISVWEPIEIHEDVDLNIIDTNTADNTIDAEVKRLCSEPKTTGTMQHSLWNGRYENHDSVITPSEPTLSSDNEEILEWLCEEAESILHKMSYGIDGFKDLCYKFKEINKKMKAIKSSFKLDIPGKEDADMLYSSEPTDFIIPIDGEDGGAITDLNTFVSGVSTSWGYNV